VKQPTLGLVASALVMAVSLAYISLFPVGTFLGWVSLFMLGLIPMQVVIVVLWGGNPSFVRGQSQPRKGTALVMLTVLVAMAATMFVHTVVGDGVSPPGPIPSHFAVVVVPTTFWLAIMMGGWPFTTLIKSPVTAGFLVVLVAYILTYIEFRVFFNYDFMQGAPVYLATAPHGMVNAITALVFHVTALAVMFLVLCFDLWPLTSSPAVMKQPVLGLVWSAISLGGAALAMWIGVGVLGMDPMSFLTGVTAPFIFGSIVLLNMMQNSLFATMTQPSKGLANAIGAAVVGVVLAHLYTALTPLVSGTLQAGPPAYDLEVWLANSLLSVTFPFLIYYAVFFEYWPLPKPVTPPAPART
jgi:hypothetical protein